MARSSPVSDRELLDRAYGASRRSPQRESIARAVRSIAGAFSVDALVRRVHESDPGIGAATVYRAVTSMVEHGYLESVGEHDGRTLYLHCGADEHHHHLVCTGCGSFTPVPCPLDDHAIHHAAEQGFVITHHEVSVYGLCARCLRLAEAARTPDCASAQGGGE